MEDLISRQAAIEAVKDEWDGCCSEYDAKTIIHDTVERIEQLPSAQPEIIHCKDCEYGKQDDVGRWFCRGFGCQVGDEYGNGFCSDAERRKDGSD